MERLSFRSKNHIAYLILETLRLLDGPRLETHAQAIRHRHYTKVCVTATDHQQTTYFVRRQEGRLADIPHNVRVFFSKWHPRAKALAYILCTDLSCSAKQALQ